MKLFANIMKPLCLIAVLIFTLATSAGAATKFKKPSGLSCRDAKTGQFVTTAYAKKFPGLTVCEQKKSPEK